MHSPSQRDIALDDDLIRNHLHRYEMLIVPGGTTDPVVAQAAQINGPFMRLIAAYATLPALPNPVDLARDGRILLYVPLSSYSKPLNQKRGKVLKQKKVHLHRRYLPRRPRHLQHEALHHPLGRLRPPQDVRPGGRRPVRAPAAARYRRGRALRRCRGGARDRLEDHQQRRHQLWHGRQLVCH
jgi:hypothetical protein